MRIHWVTLLAHNTELFGISFSDYVFYNIEDKVKKKKKVKGGGRTQKSIKHLRKYYYYNN